jgi:biopolymer transport protein TolQ
MDTPVLVMILRAGVVSKLIILLLLVSSVLTWAIIFSRWSYLAGITKTHRLFRRKFENLKSLTELEGLEAKLERSPLGQMGKSGLGELKRIVSDAKLHTGVKDWSFYLQAQFNMAAEHFTATATSLIGNLDRGLIVLAVASSGAPFLGLLGTVWGIMNSFYQIGNQGSASLPVVAPGIAEALIVTLGGLAVAIPAVISYNLLTRQVQRVEDDIDEFGDQLLLRLKREIFNLLYSEKQFKQAAGGGQ